MKKVRTLLRTISPILMVVCVLAANAGNAPTAQAISQSNISSQHENITKPTDTWAVQIKSGSDPDQIAKTLGAENLGQIGPLENYYLFRISDSNKVKITSERFKAESNVIWFEQQIAYQQSKRLVGNPWGDPWLKDQWHLKNIGQSGGTSGEDINVIPVWNMNYTGNGIRIAVVDDGLQYDHPDLASNYKQTSSYDYYDSDSDPYPLINEQIEDDHGTPVAGIVAAGDNASCGVGVAYKAGLSGIRLIAGPTTDAMEAAALTHFFNDPDNMNHIFTNSWGPSDLGDELRGPGPLTLAALESGVTNGRNGLGSIYLWSAGDGLAQQDNVNFDGYANSRYTIAVGAIDHNGLQSYYSEPGAAMLVTAYSAGGESEITTTDLAGENGNASGDCTNGFGGTSASTPLVAGVVALMLEANPNLGWRDVQYILAQTAVKNNPTDTGWAINAAGYSVNHKYGFGRVDALAAVNRAKTWENIPLATSFTSPVQNVSQAIPDNDSVGITSTITTANEFILEHVEVVLNATHLRRGDLQVTLTSPSGTESVLATPRLADVGSNFTGWKFMTVRNWGETSTGTWSLKVTDTRGNIVGTLNDWQLILHGYVDVDGPKVISITRSNPNPTKSSSVNFTVSFSEPVVGVSTGDFSLNTVGSISGATVSSVSGLGVSRTVAVNTGTGIGTLQLNIPGAATITDTLGHPTAELPYSGQTYNVRIQSFVDVPISHSAWQWIEQLYSAGITGGCSASPLKYCPDNSVTRGQMAVFLLRSKYSSSYTPPAVGDSTGFADVPITHQFAAWIKQLAAEGITTGCGGGNYCPDSPVNRAQMALFLLRGKYSSSYSPPDVGGSTGFIDVPITHPQAAWIKQLAAEGVTTGCGGDNYCPTRTVTRAQMAIFLVRAFNLP